MPLWPTTEGESMSAKDASGHEIKIGTGVEYPCKVVGEYAADPGYVYVEPIAPPARGILPQSFLVHGCFLNVQAPAPIMAPEEGMPVGAAPTRVRWLRRTMAHQLNDERRVGFLRAHRTVNATFTDSDLEKKFAQFKAARGYTNDLKFSDLQDGTWLDSLSKFLKMILEFISELLVIIGPLLNEEEPGGTGAVAPKPA